MKELSIIDALDIMQSDMKLWDHSEKAQTKGGLKLTLNLPWGIGETSVTLEGMGDAKARRHAVGAYGDYIRGLIKERIDDTAVTARARQAAARREQDDSRDRTEVGTGPRVREQAVSSPAYAEAGKAHNPYAAKPIGLGETLVARRVEVNDRIDWERNTIAAAEYELNQLYRELDGINAALKVMGEVPDAPKDSRTPETSAGPEAEVGETVIPS